MSLNQWCQVGNRNHDFSCVSKRVWKAPSTFFPYCFVSFNLIGPISQLQNQIAKPIENERKREWKEEWNDHFKSVHQMNNDFIKAAEKWQTPKVMNPSEINSFFLSDSPKWYRMRNRFSFSNKWYGNLINSSIIEQHCTKSRLTEKCLGVTTDAGIVITNRLISQHENRTKDPIDHPKKGRRTELCVYVAQKSHSWFIKAQKDCPYKTNNRMEDLLCLMKTPS